MVGSIVAQVGAWCDGCHRRRCWREEDLLEPSLVTWGSRCTGLRFGSAKQIARRSKMRLDAGNGKPCSDVVVCGEKPTCLRANGRVAKKGPCILGLGLASREGKLVRLRVDWTGACCCWASLLGPVLGAVGLENRPKNWVVCWA